MRAKMMKKSGLSAHRHDTSDLPYSKQKRDTLFSSSQKLKARMGARGESEKNQEKTNSEKRTDTLDLRSALFDAGTRHFSESCQIELFLATQKQAVASLPDF